MTTKEWLKRARILDKEINQLIIAKQEAFERAIGSGIDPSKEYVQGGEGNGTEVKLIRLADYELMLDEKIDKMVAIKEEIIRAIDKVDNGIYRTILLAYYVNCKTWEQVAEDMRYSVRWVHTIHGRALKEIGEVLNLS